jgi:mono/diheme cytochrome c family protein
MKRVRFEKMPGSFQSLWLSLALAACQQSASSPPSGPALSQTGQAFAQASCGECHAVGRYGRSSYSSAPPFHVVANQEGVTAETLSVWLRGAHNYPTEMDFFLHEPEVDALVAYMLTLKDPNYRRPAD